MASDRFRSVALALRGHVTDTYALLAATDAVVALDSDIPSKPLPTITSPDGRAMWDWTNNRWAYQHDTLVNIAMDSPVVMASMRDTKKIAAIRELRGLTGGGLKACKDAVEDPRVEAALNDPWGPYSRVEPPF